MGAEVFHTLKAALKKAGHNTNVGDEGGFAPDLPSAEAALDFIMQAVEKAGYRMGDDVGIALDCAATEFFRDGAYRYEGEGKVRDPEDQAATCSGSPRPIPIVSIEDGMAEDDWDGWQVLSELLGGRCQLVGDDLFVTNTRAARDGIERRSPTRSWSR
jgi:enolase